ncbi:DNA cytosine methyltransferase [Pimelobacter simplex]|uniref:DNA cytosine methyltransferase n=1 Tax=Nocardioides simplex TaxID=2045 RepID=UPI00214F765E|nr:DNA cytosine methyltransferase [Pimelobacter simplex]UUW88361.1 DNA cytosine methyltransferase [Pimelobacter simplex]UUW97865.1 DNA cytosine methyltransferase [Pimelobacter simplex]
MTPVITQSPFQTAEWSALDAMWLDYLGITPIDPNLPGHQVTMLDLFCGAGGSSSGAHSIPGVKVIMAANHWPLAVETHNTNHPETDHDCADLSQVDPRRYPRTDGLWASPECTNHSQAKGRKTHDEASERSRATMWDVCRFAEHHRYKFVIVENVVDVVKWVGYRGWITTMTDLGYDHKVVYLNSMHANQAGLPAPQSRDRVYVVFWRRGDRRPDFEKWTSPRAVCSMHGRIRATQDWKKPDNEWGRYRAQYVYRCPATECGHEVVDPMWLPALYAIDLSIPGTRIGDRKRPLATKTRARIEAGVQKWWRPFTLEAAGNTFERRPGVRTWPADQVLTTLHTTASKALCVPVEGRDGKTALPALEPMRTMTTRNETGLLVPAGGTWNDEATTLSQPMRTRTTRETEALVIPMRNNNTVKSAGDPLDTVAANGNHHGLLVPYYGSARSAAPVTDPMGTLTTLDRYAMVTRHNGEGAWSSTGIDDVLRTITTGGRGGANQSLTEWTGELPDIDDCLFRMLEPHEIKVGMAFSRSYVLLGNKREQVRLAGNAVTPPAARDIVGMMVEALTGELVLAA